MDDETVALDITHTDLERQGRVVARPALHRELRPTLNGYRREDVDRALSAADKRIADLERDNAALASTCENSRLLVEDLRRRLAVSDDRLESVQTERDSLRERLDNPWKTVGEAGENLVKAAKAEAERIRSEARDEMAVETENAKKSAAGLLSQAQTKAEETGRQAAGVLQRATEEAGRLKDAAEREMAESRNVMAKERKAHEEAMAAREHEADESAAKAAAAVAKARSALKGLLDALD